MAELLAPPAEKENTPPAEADLETGGGAPPPAPPPKIVSFLAPAAPEKLKVAGPGSVADLPNEKRLAGFSLVWPATVLLLLLKEKAAPVLVV